MTDNEAEVLAALADLIKGDTSPSMGHAPMEFGGSGNSHHSTTAKRMIGRLWVERRYRGQDWGAALVGAARGSCLYRITPAGLRALANHRASRRPGRG